MANETDTPENLDWYVYDMLDFEGNLTALGHDEDPSVPAVFDSKEEALEFAKGGPQVPLILGFDGFQLRAIVNADRPEGRSMKSS